MVETERLAESPVARVDVDTRGHVVAWTTTALVVFVLAFAATFRDVWREGVDEVFAHPEGRGAWAFTAQADIRFGAWGVSRNARTLAGHPADLLDAEPCYPAEHVLLLGHPMISVGLVGVPAAWLSDDPIVVYNLTVLLVILVGAMAMYWLIAEWTGLPPAGIAAGLVYVLGAPALSRVVHLYHYDTSFTVLSLFFLQRLFVSGRWRDGLGVGVAGSLQLLGGLYCAVGGLLVGAPFALWLLLRHELRGLRAGPALLALALPVATVAVMFTMVRGGGSGEHVANLQVFTSWSRFSPSHPGFPGFLAVLAIAVGLLARHAKACPRLDGDPRPALVLGFLAVMLVSTNTLGLYDWLATSVPGLVSARAPSLIATAAHIVSSILAGLGFAVVVRLARGWVSFAVAVTLIAATFVDVVRPPGMGLEPRVPLSMSRIRPPEAELEFFEALAKLGNDGPVLELPVGQERVVEQASRVLLSAYHGRRTSSCYNSAIPRELEELAQVAVRLPRPGALRKMRSLGFTTVVLRDPGANGLVAHQRVRFAALAKEPDPPVRRLHAAGSLIAYEILPVSRSTAGESQ